MKICHGGPGYKEDERMHWLSKKRYKIGLVIPTLVVYMVFIIIRDCEKKSVNKILL